MTGIEPPPGLLGDEGLAEWHRVRDVLGLRGDWRPKFAFSIENWCTQWELLVQLANGFRDSGDEALLTDDAGQPMGLHSCLQEAEKVAFEMRKAAAALRFNSAIVERRIDRVMMAFDT